MPNLTWTHYRELLTVSDENARHWYMTEANREMWSVRALHRNISSQYHNRLLQSQVKDIVIDQTQKKSLSIQDDKFEFIKNPVVAEFLGLSHNIKFSEIQKFFKLLTL